MINLSEMLIACTCGIVILSFMEKTPWVVYLGNCVCMVIGGLLIALILQKSGLI